LLGLNSSNVSFWHGKLQHSSSSRSLYLCLFNINLFRMSELCNLSVDIYSQIGWLQINVNFVCWKVFRYFNLEDNLGFIWGLVISPFIFSVICLSYCSIHVINRQGLVFLSVQLVHHLIVFFEHRVFLALFLGLLSSLFFLFIAFPSPRWGIGIWVKSAFFYFQNFFLDISSCYNSEVFFHHLQHLFGF